MTTGPRDTDLLIDLYLDSELDDATRATFEARLAADALLRSEFDELKRLDERTRRGFTPPPFQIKLSEAALTSATIALANPKTYRFPNARLKAYAAAAALLLCIMGGLWYYSTLSSVPGTKFLSPFAVYNQLKEGGFTPTFVCTTDKEFAEAVEKRYGQPLLLAAAPQMELLGWAYSNAYKGITISPQSLILMARVEGDPVILFMDKKSRDRSLPTSGSGLKLYRREVGDLVLYEVTPRDKSFLIDRAMIPVP